MKRPLLLLSGVTAAVTLAAGCSAFRGGYETAPYKVVRTEGAFEIRDYPELKIASTNRGRDNESFMGLFRYISGDNTTREKIAMTTPVFMVDSKMAFVVPEKHKAATPAPKSTDVVVETMRAQRVATYRFSGERSEDSGLKAVQKLETWMRENQLEADGKAFSAYYDPPWTPTFLRRNEVLIPIKSL